MKKLIGLTIILVMTVPCAAKYSGGAGTAENPYKIADYNDLYTLADDANDYNKCFVMVADIDLNPTLPGRRQLTTALIAPDTNTSYGFQGTRFTGTFDGNDCNILNLTIDTNGLDNDYLGLFGFIDFGGSVSDLGLEDVNISGSGTSRYVGGLVGENWYGSVTNCYATAAVAGDYYVGGLVGMSYHGSVTNCYATGTVDGGDYVGGLIGNNDYYGSVAGCFATGAVTGTSYVGGLVGKDGHGSITNCYAIGAVTANDSFVGGLVGWNGSSVALCYATGAVSGYGYDVGGMVGWNDGSITNCYATGAVTGYCFVGGLVGRNYVGGVTDCYATGPVTGDDCLGGLVGQNDYGIGVAASYFLDPNDGGGPDNGLGIPLTDTQMRQQSSFVGWDFIREPCNGTHEFWMMPNAGGYPILSIFNGYLLPLLDGSGTIGDPYLVTDANDLGTILYRPDAHYRLIADINLTCISWSMPPIPEFAGIFDGNDHTISNLVISGGDFLGLFGRLSENSCVMSLGLKDVNIIGNTYSDYLGGLCGYSSGTITNCSTIGSVTGGDCVGGLVGYNNDGSVTECHATGPVIGDEYIGGLVGYTDDGSMITNCYVTGAITGSSDVGGLVGRSYYGSVTNCYATGVVSGADDIGGLIGFDYESGGVFVSSYFLDPNDGGGPNNGIGEPLTDTEMKQQASFIDWDFINIWSICEAMNYPKLTWQIPLADMLCPDGVTFIDYSYFADHWLWSDYGDVNGLELSGNGKIENADFALFASWWGQTACGDCGGADYSGDNAVDSADLQILFDNWLATDYGDCKGAELTGDGFVGIDDALAFSEQWLAGF